MAEVPEVFNQPGAGFVLLPDGVKFPPAYKEWQKPENARTYAQAQAHKGNVGILAGNGYIGLDKDNPAAFDGLALPTTTMWETRPGRLGLWFKVSDDIAGALVTIGKKADQAQIYLFRDGKPCGEVKLQKTYQVIPPSWKTLEDGNRADYKLLDSSPPGTISLAKLLADLQAIGITFNKRSKTSRLESNAARLEGMAKEAPQRRTESDESQARRYAVAALQDEVHTMAGTPQGSRNDQLNRSAFNLGQFVAAGVLSEAEVISGLSAAAMNAGLEREEARATIISGLEAGRQHPRQIPEAVHYEEIDHAKANPPLTRERADQIEAATGVHIYNAVDDPDTGITEEELKELPRTFNPRLEVHLEDGNFITKYMLYGKTTSDAYEEYHFASGLVLLSVAADRQIVISMKHGDIYPNIWIFPIGDSTVSRKTTAHKLCKLILKNKYPRKSLPSSFSPEALMDAISETPRCYYLKDEAGSLLASLCKDYMAETRDFLAEIFECDDYYRKLKKSVCQITDPYITQYLMTTPDNLKEYTTPLDLTSGWLLRYLWMYPNYPKDWKPFAEKDASDFERFATITGEYNLIVEKLATARRLTMTGESMQFYQEWHRSIEETAMKEADNITKALAGRLTTYAIKMAALFTIGREDFDENSQIELPHIQEAARLVESYFLPIGRIIIDEVARAESKNLQEKILGTLKRFNGRISQRDLLRALHTKLSDVDDAIKALMLSEEIQSVQVKGKKGTSLYYVSVKSKTEECHSVIVSHDLVYKGNNKSSLYTPSIDTMTHRQMGQDGEDEVGGTPPTIGPHPRKEDPGFTKFKAGMAKRQCCLCGRSFPYNLTPYMGGGKRGYICATCHMGGAPSEPIKADPQTSLADVQAT